MATVPMRRLVILLLAALVVVSVVWAWEPDPFTWPVLILAGLGAGVLLLSAWRRVAQDVRDAEAMTRLRSGRRGPPESVDSEDAPGA